MSFWDDDEIKGAAEGGKFIKFDAVGDTATGTISELGKERDPWDRVAIRIKFEDGRIVNFAQQGMLHDLFMLQPVIGETLTATLADVVKNGAKTTKNFRGELIRLDGSVEKFDQTKQ